MEKNGTFTFKTHSKFKTPGSSSSSGLFQPFKTNVKPVAAVVPNPVRQVKLVQILYGKKV